MKSIINQIKESINEARNEIYHVSLIDVVDAEGLPVDIDIMVDRKHTRTFEKWLEDEEGNIFAHAEGGNIEY